MSGVNYKYELQKGSKHILCPKCQKKTFKPYVKVGTNIIVDAMKYGICERKNHCRYHRYPDTNEDWTPPPFVYTPPKPIDYVPVELMERSFSEFKNNPFFRYLVKIFGKDKAFDLQEQFNIGTAKNGGTIFWQVDGMGRVRTGKVMYYNKDTGKRLKDKNSWYIHNRVKEEFNLQQCLFGLHLTSMDRPVALCESEKTAVLMSVFRPEFDWVAAGGANMLNDKRLNELPRLDYVFADNGQFQLWERKSGAVFPDRQMDVSVDRAVREGVLKQGDDILDLELIKRGLA